MNSVSGKGEQTSLFTVRHVIVWKFIVAKTEPRRDHHHQKEEKEPKDGWITLKDLPLGSVACREARNHAGYATLSANPMK